ncbi:hypothetical protein ACTXT7_006472 [Hymenolepis weldensis]
MKTPKHFLKSRVNFRDRQEGDHIWDHFAHLLEHSLKMDRQIQREEIILRRISTWRLDSSSFTLQYASSSLVVCPSPPGTSHVEVSLNSFCLVFLSPLSPPPPCRASLMGAHETV